MGRVGVWLLYVLMHISGMACRPVKPTLCAIIGASRPPQLLLPEGTCFVHDMNGDMYLRVGLSALASLSFLASLWHPFDATL